MRLIGVFAEHAANITVRDSLRDQGRCHCGSGSAFGRHGPVLLEVEKGWSVWKYFLYASIQLAAISCWATGRSSLPWHTKSRNLSSSASFTLAFHSVLLYECGQRL